MRLTQWPFLDAEPDLDQAVRDAPRTAEQSVGEPTDAPPTCELSS